MPHPPLIAISLLSACVLAYEVLLTRLFSIVLWHHFAYMIISAAMLGYGASGTALTLLRERLLIRQVDSMNPLVLSLSKYERTHGLRQAQAERDRNFNHAGSIAPHFGAIYVAAAAALALLMPTTFVLAQQVPFNPLELLWDATQPFKLLAVYLLMMLPFFFGGLGIGLVFARFGAQASRVYACDILGAGAGSLGVVAALFIVPPGQMLSALAAMALLAAAIATVELKARPRLLMPSFLVLALLAATTLPEISVQPSPYKDLSQALNIAGARIVEQRSSPLGLVTVVENARVPLRHAPGMSLNATSEPPPQLGVFIDGDGPSALTRFDGSLAPLAYLDQLTSALPYHLLQRPRVLVLGAGPGGDVLQALYHRSAVIDAVELDHNVTGLVKGRFRDYAGALYQQPGVQVYEAEARGFVSGSDRLYDLIQVALLDSFGTASAGLYGLSENYLYTVEAFRAYLKRLAPGGILAVTRWLTLPPRDALKLFGTAVTALEAVGAANPGTQIAMIRGWKTVTLLVKNGGFTANEIAAMRRFTRARSFDLAWYPGMHADEANRFNVLPQPFFFEGAVELLGPQQQDFIERYKFHIEPATDDRPHFFRFFKWKAAGEIFSLREQGGMALFDWSYPLLVATLAQAIAASALLILLPLALSRCRRTLPAAPAALYFLAIGFAFMFMEIAFIQKFVLFLSHPLYAVAVVLCAFLVFASAGSWLAGRMQGERWRPSRKVTFAVVSIGVIALFYLATLPTLFQWLIHLSDPAKIVISVALIAPLAMCMGVPFPTGMMRLAHVAPVAIPWAWAINGFASVVGAVLATLLAIHLGFAVVILLAVLIYAVACAALIRFA